MLKILDTNLIIRYLFQDDIELARQVEKMIDKGVHILPESIVEVTYVLNKAYKVSRKDISYALMDFLEDVDVIDKEIYIEALRFYRDSKLDYVDCLFAARHKLLKDEIYTMDKELNKVLKSLI